MDLDEFDMAHMLLARNVVRKVLQKKTEETTVPVFVVSLGH